MHKFLPLHIGLYVHLKAFMQPTSTRPTICVPDTCDSAFLCVSSILLPSLSLSLSLSLSQNYIRCDIRWICLPCNRTPNPPLNVRSVMAFRHVSYNRDCYVLSLSENVEKFIRGDGWPSIKYHTYCATLERARVRFSQVFLASFKF